MSDDTNELKCTPTEAFNLLRGLWTKLPGAHFQLDVDVESHIITRRGQRCVPLGLSAPYESDEEENPMWNIMGWFPAFDDDCHCTKLPKAYGWILADDFSRNNLGRNGMCLTYSFSIPTPSDLSWIKKMIGPRPIVELGAGRGYWAMMLQRYGLTVHAYDPLTPGEDNEYFKTPGQFTTVLRRDQRAVDDHPDDVLMLIWPGYDDPWCEDALARYRGDTLIYAGEGYGGCTGTDAFHETLERDWDWLGSSDGHATWWGIHDGLHIYTRKQRALPTGRRRAALTKGE